MNTSASPKPMLGHPLTEVASAIDCQRRCQQEAYCEYFSWTYTTQSSGSCELTGAWGVYVTDQTGYVAGPKNCTSGPPSLTEAEKKVRYSQFMADMTSRLYPQLFNTNASAAQLYSTPMAKAFAALAKLAYCGPGPEDAWMSGPRYGLPGKMPEAVQASCGKYCEEAGFTVGNTSLVAVAAFGQDSAQFGYVSQVLPTAGGGPAFAQCVIAFRGTYVQPANQMVNMNNSLFDFQSPSCSSGCRVAWGPYGMYLDMEPLLLQELNALGCPTGSTIAVTGHSLGGEIASIAMFFLADRRGYNIALSYTFEQPKAFNRRAVEVMEHIMTRHRPISYFRVTHKNDWVVRIPLNPDMYHAGYQVWFRSSTLAINNYEFCGTYLESNTSCADGFDLDKYCKMYGSPAWLECGGTAPFGGPHCNHPLAPALNFCSVGGSMQDYSGSPVIYGYTCVLGNPLPEHAILPTNPPAAWPVPPRPAVQATPAPVPAPAPTPPPAPMPPIQNQQSPVLLVGHVVSGPALLYRKDTS